MIIIEDKKTICLYTGSNRTKLVLCKQLQEILGNNTHILSYAIDEETPRHEDTDLTILSSSSVEEELIECGFLNPDMTYFVCGRRINFDNIESILRIPKGEVALFVNDTKDTTMLCIQNLKDIGIDHIDCQPFYPGCEAAGDYNYAITAGEMWLVPENINNKFDLGPRHIDIPSLLKIVDLLDIKEFDVGTIIKPYTDKIIDISKKMVVINTEAEGIRHLLKEKLESKGYTALYTFESIKGNSPNLLEVKHKAQRLANTDLTILIEGESGTGKELFASAIHNASKRKNGPYLAVNFSALPEELVESELFGYEEGAFTGAKKGGKTGLFEQADGGTIFLDEIGDISPRMQTKLLRVLQEKEIMPVGGGSIKKVDIRVIAATNKNLKFMVNQGTFRDDLYYRLKIGYVNVPSLRERKEDIKCLMSYFVQKEEETKVSIDKEVYDKFLKYDWRGNVRELKNTIKYMMAIRENPCRITAIDLPDIHFFEEISSEKEEESRLDYHLEVILQAISEINKKGLNAGRKIVTELLNQREIQLTENQVRKRIDTLCQKGFVEVSKGKMGTTLTDKGRRYMNKNGMESEQPEIKANNNHQQ
ncbi:sigma-54 interaction domain-containing protein [Aminipila sp.]|uniref:sigma-54 interaction domain-containing protein n=1 Tax=Aminipila sp. TaxID=2060095 RepID=UPI00289B9308|nr:sigma 54-interacting transcriptional regulator [Aminipila sp.]